MTYEQWFVSLAYELHNESWVMRALSNMLILVSLMLNNDMYHMNHTMSHMNNTLIIDTCYLNNDSSQKWEWRWVTWPNNKTVTRATGLMLCVTWTIMRVPLIMACIKRLMALVKWLITHFFVTNDLCYMTIESGSRGEKIER